MRCAVASAGRQAASAPLRGKPAIPYTAARLSTAIEAAKIKLYLRRLGAPGVVSVSAVMIEQTVDVNSVP
jgi:hypothetical protein